MAKISFRQGIITHPKDTITGKQTFLVKSTNGTSVDIVIDSNTSAEPITVAFSHNDTDYMYTENVSVTNAWINCPVGLDYWLYWELDLNTGEMTRGYTILEPIYQSATPTGSSVVMGQMWYDTANAVFKEWQGTVWREVIRVLAAKLVNGTTFHSVSVNAGSGGYSGTQVGVYENKRLSRKVGSLVYNKSGKAIKSGEGRKFFTTEDTFLTGVPTGASLRINNNIISGTAICPIAAFQLVQYNDYNKICLANAYEQGDKVFGIVESDVETGEVTSFTTEGIIFNENWDWEAAGVAINSPVYIDNITKKLSNVISIVDKPPVGLVIGRREVYFAPRLFPSVHIASSGSMGLTPTQLAQLNVATQVSDSNAADIASINSTMTNVESSLTTVGAEVDALETTVATKLPLVGGTLTGPLTLPAGTPMNPLNAVNKDYVDTLLLGYNTTFLVSDWTTGTTKSFTVTQAQHGMAIGIAYDAVVLDDTGQRIFVDYRVDQTTGDVTLYTTGEPFSGTLRFR